MTVRSASVAVGFVLGYAAGLLLLAVSVGVLPGWTIIPAVLLISLVAVWAVGDR